MSSTAFGTREVFRESSPSFAIGHPDANFYTSVVTGGATVNLVAGNPVYSFRTGSATAGQAGAGMIYVVNVVKFIIQQTTAFAAAAVNSMDLYVARSFSASDSGGTAAVITGNQGKQRTADATMTVADIRVSNTGTLTAGTRTLDTNPLSSVQYAHNTTANTNIANGTALIASTGQGGDFPLILAANEGFVIQVGQNFQNATGVNILTIETEWFEVPAGSW